MFEFKIRRKSFNFPVNFVVSQFSSQIYLLILIVAYLERQVESDFFNRINLLLKFISTFHDFAKATFAYKFNFLENFIVTTVLKNLLFCLLDFVS